MGQLFGPSRNKSANAYTFGRQFSSDDERRSHYMKLLKERLQDRSFRNSNGFPEASDEDILKASDPPYYTACPNPFLQDLLSTLPTQPVENSYKREPFRCRCK